MIAFKFSLFTLLLSVGLSTITYAQQKQKTQRPIHITEAEGYRYWAPFKRTELIGAYTSMVRKANGDLKFFHLQTARLGKDKKPQQVVVFAKGKSIFEMRPQKATLQFAPRQLINDVFDPKHPKKLAPNRDLSRLFVTHDDKRGYVALGCVMPEYRPGQVELTPALFVSKSGKEKTWTYLGKLKGDPETYIKNSKRGFVWSDGGSIMRLANGKWRIYVNNFKGALNALEAEKLEGPWRFLRDDQGEIKNLASNLPLKEMQGGAPFPTILRVSENNWHAWFSDQWPVHHIYHMVSKDGLTWTPYKKQPEISRKAFGGKAIKNIRVWHDPEKNKIHCTICVWEVQPRFKQPLWQVYTSSMGTK